MTEWDDLFGGRPERASVQWRGCELRPGSRVRLAPRRRADILDLAMAGKVARIASIEEDLEGQVHLAVTLEDDPGSDLGAQRLVGHRFFFALDEVEGLAGAAHER